MGFKISEFFNHKADYDVGNIVETAKKYIDDKQNNIDLGDASTINNNVAIDNIPEEIDLSLDLDDLECVDPDTNAVNKNETQDPSLNNNSQEPSSITKNNENNNIESPKTNNNSLKVVFSQVGQSELS